LSPGDEYGVLFTKNVVFRVFVEQVSPAAGFMPPAAVIDEYFFGSAC